MKFEIKARFTGSVLFECEALNIRIALEKAVEARANLKGANLKGAYLEGANLQGADLKGAYLQGADLEGAYLEGADLKGAYLEGATLQGADLKGADLEGANLKGAYLEGADLEGANLKGIKSDFFKRLLIAKDEVIGLYKSIMEGKIDGSVYEGECACFCGTVAKIRNEDYRTMGIDLRPQADSPTERWFLGISKGDTPSSNQISAITAEWIREFSKENSITLPSMQIIWE